MRIIGEDGKKSREERKKLVVEQMQALGTYKEEFESVINLFCDMVEQYEVLTEEFVRNGMPYADIEEGKLPRKSIILQSLESLRKDIMTCSDKLQLNPKAFQVEAVEEKKAGLEDVLASLKVVN